MTEPVIYLTAKQLGLDTQNNSVAILVRAKRAMRLAGVDKEIIEAFFIEARRGNYDHLCRVVREWCGVDELGE